jgi:hypothetical protein
VVRVQIGWWWILNYRHWRLAQMTAKLLTDLADL